MTKKNSRLFIILVVLVIIAWLITDILDQKGKNDLKGGFTEVASYRNENNTGPVQRIFSVSVKDTADAELEHYGNLMPHNKYGNTKVYFFKEGNAVPTALFPGAVNFDAEYRENCFAVYEKSAMGNVGLVINPFKQKQRSQ
ncbi:MAG: hypothetical protein ACQUHE_00630 [Bacteroidia bacterium]